MHWISKIEQAWQQKTIIWLAGVRRVGKTVLCRALSDVEYFDCELPRIRQQMQDPEYFLKRVAGERIVLDEIHRLDNPSELLKIAADHYPSIKIIATGSSTLAASAKFRDSLTGRRKTILITPMLSQDLQDFGNISLQHRFIHGGLPPFFIQSSIDEREYQEWMDAYWSKDILELFKLERRYSFLKFAELIFTQSGAMFDATRFAAPCEVSRSTITNYLSVLEATLVAHIVRPFSSRKSTEIVTAPKVYAFDTGFVCYYRGWNELREDDFGQLWEHYVLNEMIGVLQTTDIHYWRDKADHEIDFVLPLHNKSVDAIECKMSSNAFEPGNLYSFRKRHPEGRNFVVCSNVEASYERQFKDLTVEFVSLDGLMEKLKRKDIAG
jgi:predicted AAA+ superfamily ATPase